MRKALLAKNVRSDGGTTRDEGTDWGGGERRRNALHASRAAGPVAVVEVEALALEDESAEAILRLLDQQSPFVQARNPG